MQGCLPVHHRDALMAAQLLHKLMIARVLAQQGQGSVLWQALAYLCVHVDTDKSAGQVGEYVHVLLVVLPLMIANNGSCTLALLVFICTNVLAAPFLWL